MNAPVIRLEHRQQQTLTPKLQQAVRLLQLSSLDFALEIKQTAMKNPFIEDADLDDQSEHVLETDTSESHADDEHASHADAADGAPIDLEPSFEDRWTQSAQTILSEAVQDGERGEHAAETDLFREREAWNLPSRQAGHDQDGDITSFKAADTSLKSYLHQQINTMSLNKSQSLLAHTLIEALDDDGYLRLELSDIQDLVSDDINASLMDVESALSVVQSLDPCGVGARSVRECLMLQLSEKNFSKTHAENQWLAYCMVKDGLEGVAKRDINGLSKRLGKSTAQIETAYELIRRLNPRPGWAYGSSQMQYIVPDIFVRKVKGVWTAQLNSSVVPRIRLNEMYASLFQQHRSRSGHGEMAAHLQEARWMMKNVEQRFSTILSVSEAILKRQHQFLDHGPLAMKPLGLSEIAQELGLHESTVSRVTNNKYMSTPSGIFELKYFFTRSMTTSSGGTCSTMAIRGVIKEMLDAEKETAPLSDAEIARRLARQGLVVARRTVTKYRQMMKVPAVEFRRKHV